MMEVLLKMNNKEVLKNYENFSAILEIEHVGRLLK